jgi:DNA-binding NtrC family response regulator
VTEATSERRLLAIDDNVDSAELIARVAGKCGYAAQCMSDTRTLSEVLESWNPQVLTLDLCMPQEDGIALISSIKASGFSGTLIIISGQDDWLRRAAAKLAVARGIDVVHDMAKPIDVKTLRDLLAKLDTVSAPRYEDERAQANAS